MNVSGRSSLRVQPGARFLNSRKEGAPSVSQVILSTFVYTFFRDMEILFRRIKFMVHLKV